MISMSCDTARMRNLLRLIFPALLVVAAAAPAAATAAPDKPREPKKVVDSYIVVYRGSVDDPKAKTDKLERGKGFKARFDYGRALKGFAAKLNARHVEELRADP